jgi:hypothetical protein
MACPLLMEAVFLNNPHVLTEEEVWKLMVLNIFEDVEEETLVIR